jgi:DUF1009 family protein
MRTPRTGSKLGILAGRGRLPREVVDACRAEGRPHFVVAFKGHTEPAAVAGAPHVWVRLGAAGTAVRLLREAGVEDLVMAGAIRRPGLAELRPDLWAVRFFARSGAALLGDDGLLTALARALEEEGFRVVGIDDVLPGLLAPAGVWGRVQPGPDHLADVARAAAAARDLGARDLGQAAVARRGRVVGLEGRDGTDALLARLDRPAGSAPEGVLVKVKKPGQERRADLPTIGVDTVEAANRAGLAGIAVEAGGSLVIEREVVVETADRSGLFVMGVVVGEAGGG